MAPLTMARLGRLARRLGTSRVVDAAVPVLATPYVRSRRGTNIVVSAHYSMQLGINFDDDEAAARHYFHHGWKLGVVPTPFIDAPAVRFSRAASLLLRNQLARIARGGEPRTRWLGTPSRLLGSFDVSEHLDDSGGWVAGLTRRARRDPRSVRLTVGLRELNYEEYIAGCRDLVAASRTALSSAMIDERFYRSQVGGARPVSREAALDDYLANGELDGRALNPFFEAEWYSVADRSQGHRGRPINLFLDFVARGELGQASPHFWGTKYLDSEPVASDGGSILAHFLENAHRDSLTPSSAGVRSITRGQAEALVRSRVRDYHDSLGRLRAHGPVRGHHTSAPRRAQATETCVVFVDEQHLRAASVIQEFAASCAQQSLSGLRVAVIETDDDTRTAQLDELVEASPFIDFVPRNPTDTVGAVVAEILRDAQPDGWTFWTPTQRWRPEFLSSAVAALAEQPGVSAAAVVSPTTPQPWLRSDDALWLDDLDGAGVVLRGTGSRAVLPDPSLDRGIVWHALIGLSASGTAAVLPADLVSRSRQGEDPDLEMRAGANAARSRHLVDFDQDPVGEVTVVIPTYQDWAMTLGAVRHVLQTTGDGVDVVVVDNGSRRPVATILAACFASDVRVTVRRMDRNTDFALGSNVGATTKPARCVVFLNNDTAVQEGWLEPLTGALSEGAGAVQPLLLYGDRTIQTAGTIFLGGFSMPRHLLPAVHPIDLDPAIDDYPFSALTAACLAMEWADVARLRGFDPHYVNGMEDVDLCLRLRADARPLAVRTSSRVVHFESRSPGRMDFQLPNRARFARRWRRVITALDDRAIFDSGPVELRDVVWERLAGSPLWEPRLVLARRDHLAAMVDESAPCLRWAIKTSATGDASGDVWGDTFFASALADALRRYGQEVVVDRASAHVRDSGGWDDVTLTLRGLVPFTPQPGATNLLWVISHPDLVTRQELESGYDRIYSAGEIWAQHVRDRWGVDVHTMLQATDTSKFNLEARGGAAHEVLFVGRTRGVSRPIVSDAIDAGAQLAVFGDDGWDRFIEPRYLKGTGIDNDDLPGAYAGATFVLNDHWRDMAEFGFFSNRLFDAAATGARVISDPVPGMTELFEGQVQSYESVDELRALLDPASDRWPDDSERDRLARSVASEHSFDARARRLLNDALAMRGRNG